MPSDDEDNEIIVEAPRIIDDDDSGGGGFGGFWGFGGWGWGLGGTGSDGFLFGTGDSNGAPPPPEDDPTEEPEIVVEATRPNKGQEDFADDNDVFNDGEAPGADTVLAWLEHLYKFGAIESFFLVADDDDNPDAGYSGEYVEADGDRFIFESDGADNYGRYQQPNPPPPPPSYPQLGLVDDWNWNPTNNPNIEMF